MIRSIFIALLNRRCAAAIRVGTLATLVQFVSFLFCSLLGGPGGPLGLPGRPLGTPFGSHWGALGGRCGLIGRPCCPLWKPLPLRWARCFFSSVCGCVFECVCVCVLVCVQFPLHSLLTNDHSQPGGLLG